MNLELNQVNSTPKVYQTTLWKLKASTGKCGEVENLRAPRGYPPRENAVVYHRILDEGGEWKDQEEDQKGEANPEEVHQTDTKEKEKHMKQC